MTIVLIRGENNQKLLNAIADVERHAGIKVLGKPRFLDAKFVDNTVESILNQKLRSKSKVAGAFFIKEDSKYAIAQIKKIHPPAHVVVVPSKYKNINSLVDTVHNAKFLKGYYSSKDKSSSLKDYKYNKKTNSTKIAY